MKEITEAIQELLKYIRDIYRIFFNLLDVMKTKGILNDTDLVYIKEHKTKYDTES